MLKLDKDIKKATIEVNNTEIVVSSNLSTYEKDAVIKAALSGCLDDKGIPSRLLFDSILYAMLVIKYSDIEIEDMGIINIVDLYDIFESNNIIKKVLAAINEINEGEIVELLNYADCMYKEFLEQLNSAGAAINSLVTGIVQSTATFAAGQKVISENQE